MRDHSRRSDTLHGIQSYGLRERKSLSYREDGTESLDGDDGPRRHSRAITGNGNIRHEESDRTGSRRSGRLNNLLETEPDEIEHESRSAAKVSGSARRRSEWEDGVLNDQAYSFIPPEGGRLTRQKKQEFFNNSRTDDEEFPERARKSSRLQYNTNHEKHDAVLDLEKSDSEEEVNASNSRPVLPDDIDDRNNSDEESSQEPDNDDSSRKYSVRDRKPREFMNIKNLGGDGGGLSSTHSFNNSRDYYSKKDRYNSRMSEQRPNYREPALKNTLHSNSIINSNSSSRSGGRRGYSNKVSLNDIINRQGNRREGTRRHFDSSSDSDDSNTFAQSSSPARHNNSSTGGGNDDHDFQYYEAARLQRERDSIRPINDTANTGTASLSSSAGGPGLGMGGSTTDHISHRDISRADAAPVAVDSSIDFASVGGLDNHIQALKEMVVLPLLYPDIFQRFDTQPPRGVLFVGPPGTGKTLTARALANSLSAGKTHGGHKVAFFMRKGADCLSKWVGEGERQLRLLFEQAKKFQPSIIFFDEIDGLAPVRSVKQDQIHASIVSTLLALMDGLDSRGQVIVIGATNRPDAIDPALRRPGRFDRELMFSLPDASARAAILNIHTAKWVPPLPVDLKAWIVDRTVGFCGADIKALCSESALVALKSAYPQIYESPFRLTIDPSTITLSLGDFAAALKKIVPASQRSTYSSAKPLDALMKPLLQDSLDQVKKILMEIFPLVKKHLPPDGSNVSTIPVTDSTQASATLRAEILLKQWATTDNDSWVSSVADAQNKMMTQSSSSSSPYAAWDSSHVTLHPRLFLTGPERMGQPELSAATLHLLEAFPVFSLDFAALIGDIHAQTPDQALVTRIQEACRAAPSVIFLPNTSTWWAAASESMKMTLLSLLESIPSSLPVLWLSTMQLSGETALSIDDRFERLVCLLSSTQYGVDDDDVSGLGIYTLQPPTAKQRSQVFRAFFYSIHSLPSKLYNSLKDLWISQTQKLSTSTLTPSAPTSTSITPTPTSNEEITTAAQPMDVIDNQSMLDSDRQNQREIRNFFRAALTELHKERKLTTFWRPVDPDLVSDYYDIIACPMDLETMRIKVDDHCYPTLEHFMNDLHQIVFNVKEYNPLTGKDQRGRSILHAACSLIDLVDSYAYHFKKEIGYDLFGRCAEIARRRGLPTPVLPTVSKVIPKEDLKYYSEILRIHEELKAEAGGDKQSSRTSANKSQDEQEQDQQEQERYQVDTTSPSSSRRRSSRSNAGKAVANEDFISLEDIPKKRRSSRVIVDSDDGDDHHEAMDVEDQADNCNVRVHFQDSAAAGTAQAGSQVSSSSSSSSSSSASVSASSHVEISVQNNRSSSSGSILSDVEGVLADDIPFVQAFRNAIERAEQLKIQGFFDDCEKKLVNCSEGWDLSSIVELLTGLNRISSEYQDHGNWDRCIEELTSKINSFY